MKLRTVFPALALVTSCAYADPVWIWLEKAALPKEQVDFRTEFTVPGDVKSAELKITCDNGATALINGRQVADNPDWMFPAKVDVKAALHPGKNEILVNARNNTGGAAMVAVLTIEGVDGKKTVVETSDAWQAVRHGQTDWKAPVVIAKYGNGPWGDAFDKTDGSPAKVAVKGRAKAPDIVTNPQDITVPPGFKVELIYAVPKDSEGSWVGLTVDNLGRLLCSDQYGGTYRLTPQAAGSSDQPKVEKLDLGLGGAHGILYAFNSLYLMVDEKVGGNTQTGLWRAKQGADGNFGKAELLRECVGGGEHGPHSAVLSPDGKSIYFNCGNHTHTPDHFELSRAAQIWGEDHILPRMWDANGHARGILAPGGYICKTDPDAKKVEIIAAGFRNEFDFAFDTNGEMFTYDADMEWDMGAPWYRPTRVNHVVSAGEYGWRSGSGKWPAYYEDSLPAAVDIGPGSPTGLIFGTGAHFPAKYQTCMFGNDWTYGTMYAIHYIPDGASFKAEKEEFLFAKPLPLTDVVINPKDGAMYFAVGGRKTQSAVYRVTYEGKESTAPVAPYAMTPELKERRDVETLHEAGTGPEAIAKAWPFLGSKDRFLRFAARVAIERQPVKLWTEKALAETDPQASIEALIALSRAGRSEIAAAWQPDVKGISSGRVPNAAPVDEALQKRVLASLGRIDYTKLDTDHQLQLIRAYQLAFTRFGKPSAETCARTAAIFDPVFPSPDAAVSRELCQLLVFLDSTKVVSKTLGLMATAKDDSEALATDALLARNANYARAADEVHKSRPNRQQMTYMFDLRYDTVGWTPELRRTYFSWFTHARTWKGGNSFKGFIENIRKEALTTFAPPAELAELEAISNKPDQSVAANIKPAEGPGQNYTTDDVVKIAQGGMTGRNFERGKNLFSAALCISCHHFAGDGGSVGPDISGAGNRYTLRDLVENITEPSKVISDLYGTTQIDLKDGSSVIGRITSEEPGKLLVMTNPFAPTEMQPVKIADIVSKKDFPVSMMPPGLINSLNPEELKDLLAYLLSGGNAQDKMFVGK